MTDAPFRGRKIPKFHSIRSVADTCEVSDRTVRRWIARGYLKAHYMGGVLRISDNDLDDFVQVSRQG